MPFRWCWGLWLAAIAQTRNRRSGPLWLRLRRKTAFSPMWKRTVATCSWSLVLAATTSFGQRYPIIHVSDSPHGIFTMTQDSRSRIWLGTIDDVIGFDGAHFYPLRQYGFPKETPNSLAEDDEGGIWIA